jgi:hypothetical protein
VFSFYAVLDRALDAAVVDVDVPVLSVLLSEPEISAGVAVVEDDGGVKETCRNFTADTVITSFI